jgi:hypothetical protein
MPAGWSVLRALERQGIVVKNGKGKGLHGHCQLQLRPPNQNQHLKCQLMLQPKKLNRLSRLSVRSRRLPKPIVLAMLFRRFGLFPRNPPHKNKLVKLEKLRDAVRVIGRHKNIMQQLVSAEAENGKA